MVSETTEMLLKALHIVVRAFLVLSGALWLLIIVEMLPVAVASGVDGVHGKLVQIWSMGKLEPAWECESALHLVHQGYTDVILFLLLTWAGLELKRFLERRIRERSQVTDAPR